MTAGMPARSRRATAALAALVVALGSAVSVWWWGLGSPGGRRASVWDGGERVLASTRWGDFGAFFSDGDLILAGRWEEAYAAAANAAGPLQVVADRLLAEWAWHAGGWWWPAVLVVAVQAALVAGLTAVLYGRGRDGRLRRVRVMLPALAAALFLATGMPSVVYLSGHWWQVWAFSSWVLAGWLLARGHWVVAAVILGVATSIEPWALLIVPPLAVWAIRLRELHWRRVVGFAGGAILAGGAAWWVFVPALMRTPIQWGTFPSSPWGLMGLETVDSMHRLAQAGLVCAAASLLAWWVAARSRSVRMSTFVDTDAWGAWLIALATGCARIFTDAWFEAYYWSGPVALLIAGIVASLALRLRGAWLLVLAVCASVVFWIPWLPVVPGARDIALWMALPLLALTILFARNLLRGEPAPRSGHSAPILL